MQQRYNKIQQNTTLTTTTTNTTEFKKYHNTNIILQKQNEQKCNQIYNKHSTKIQQNTTNTKNTAKIIPKILANTTNIQQ